MGDKFDLNIQTETDLLLVQREYLRQLENFDLVESDTVDLMIALEQKIQAEPKNMVRLRTFLRNRSNL